MPKTAPTLLASILVLTWSALLGTPSAPGASGATTQPARLARPNEMVDPTHCVTADCHAGIKNYRIIHGPVNVNSCDACHRLLDAKSHTYELARDKADLCTYCHEFQAREMPVVHKPVALGECLGCHDPHGGTSTSLTRESSTPELCARCHDNTLTESKRFLHGPVAKGQCLSCHPPHAARYPKLLDFLGTDLCLTCHTDFEARLAKAKFTHKALEKGCLQCHDAHGSDNPMEVRQPPAELCLDCHEKLKNTIAAAKFKHSVATADRACMTCHTAHGSDLAKLMSDLPGKICIDCHRQKAKTQRGYVVGTVPELSDEKMVPHGAIKDGQCGGCHAPHGGDRPMLLIKNYAASFYQRFSPEQYELCWSCHDVRLAQQAQTSEWTSFRNGDVNLHYIHVKGQWRGRSCRVCHGAHAGAKERDILERVKIKAWEAPIRFTRTATGGACAPGCHKAFAYDRDHPAAQTPTTPPEPVLVARAEPQTPLVMAWSANDAAGGKSVRVPDAQRPSVILLVRAEQSQPLLKTFAALAPDAKRAQVVVILVGPQARAESKALAKRQTLAWPLIEDGNYELSHHMGVEAWPTILVVRSDGSEAARLGGGAESLALKLDAYTDYAAQKIDRAALAERTAKPGVVSDGPERESTRQLQLAQKLLDENKPEEALKLLIQALQAQPRSIRLRMGIVKIMIEHGRAADAIRILEQVPAGELPPGRHELLRAKALIALNQNEPARAALAEALRRDASLGEAHYLLGQIHEREGQWENAAREYRAAHDGQKR